MNEIFFVLPVLVLAIAALMNLVIEGFKNRSERAAYWITLSSLAIAGSIYATQLDLSFHVYADMFHIGGMSALLSVLLCVATAMVVIVSKPYLSKIERERAEYYVIITFSLLGMLFMTGAQDLLVAFLGIELMSVALYTLAGYLRTNERSNEAALKYFLLGAFSTGFLMYGIALIYGVAGTTKIHEIQIQFATIQSEPLFLLGSLLLLAGLFFKVSAVPFHMWAPDVYEGSATSVTVFMSVVAKTAAFALFLIVIYRMTDFQNTKINNVVAGISAASMIVGNVVALAQRNLKRMLAYSSIAHAGFMLVGVAAGNPDGKTAIIFYLFAYSFMNIGAFAVISYIEQRDNQMLDYKDYKGLSHTQPWLAAGLAACLFSLAGIPPMAGFIGKYYLFVAAIESDLLWLAIVGILTSLVSVYYYLRIVVMMYFNEAEHEFASEVSKPLIASVLAISVFFLFQLGLFPSFLIDLAKGLY